jgi:hypothetical protein
MNEDDSDDLDQLEPYSEDSDNLEKKREKLEERPFALKILNLPKKLKINILREAIKEQIFIKIICTIFKNYIF